jgi:Fe-S cluster biosynthesis and repair protein YggX
MTINLNTGNNDHISECKNVLQPPLLENHTEGSFTHKINLPRGEEDARIHGEALQQFQKREKSSNHPFKIHTIAKDEDIFISLVTASQKAFDKWVKVSAALTQNQIELERQNTRIKEGLEKRKANFLQEMNEVQEMKKQVMAYYKSLVRKSDF